jgi:pyridoxine 4-dehydrogenase
MHALVAGGQPFVVIGIQNRCNLTDRDSQEVLDYCEKEKMGFLPWAPIGGSGRDSLNKSDNSLEAEVKRRNYNPVQPALAWLLQKSPIKLPIPGTVNIALRNDPRFQKLCEQK